MVEKVLWVQRDAISILAQILPTTSFLVVGSAKYIQLNWVAAVLLLLTTSASSLSREVQPRPSGESVWMEIVYTYTADRRFLRDISDSDGK